MSTQLQLLSTLFEKGHIERKIDTLCSELLSEADWSGNMEFIDLLNRTPAVEVQKEAVKYIGKKLMSKNVHVQLLACTVSDDRFDAT